MMTSIGLFNDPRNMMQASSVRKPVKNYSTPTVKANLGAENSSGWFTRYFIICKPWASSDETWRCIMIEQTNLAARTDIEAGILIVKLSSSVMVIKITRTKDSWRLHTKKTA